MFTIFEDFLDKIDSEKGYMWRKKTTKERIREKQSTWEKHQGE